MGGLLSGFVGSDCVNLVIGLLGCWVLIWLLGFVIGLVGYRVRIEI